MGPSELHHVAHASQGPARRPVPFQPFPQGHRSEHAQFIQRVEHDH